MWWEMGNAVRNVAGNVPKREGTTWHHMTQQFCAGPCNGYRRMKGRAGALHARSHVRWQHAHCAEQVTQDTPSPCPACSAMHQSTSHLQPAPDMHSTLSKLSARIQFIPISTPKSVSIPNHRPGALPSARPLPLLNRLKRLTRPRVGSERSMKSVLLDRFV